MKSSVLLLAQVLIMKACSAPSASNAELSQTQGDRMPLAPAYQHESPILCEGQSGRVKVAIEWRRHEYWGYGYFADFTMLNGVIPGVSLQGPYIRYADRDEFLWMSNFDPKAMRVLEFRRTTDTDSTPRLTITDFDHGGGGGKLATVTFSDLQRPITIACTL